MTTQELRDKLIEKRALDAKKKKDSEQGCVEMEKLFSTITEEMKEEMAAAGFNIDTILNVDYEKLKTNREYNETYNRELNSFVGSLHKYLEELVKGW